MAAIAPSAWPPREVKSSAHTTAARPSILPHPPTMLAGVKSATLPASSYDAKPATLPTSRNVPSSSSSAIRSRHVSFPRLRWRTTPGSSEPGASRWWARVRIAATSSSTGVHPSASFLVAWTADSDSAVSSGVSVISTWPAVTPSPACKGSAACTVPAHGATTTDSIFIALTTAKGAPAATESPTSARNSTRLPVTGHSTARWSAPRSSGGSSGAAAASGVGPRPPPPAAACRSRKATVSAGSCSLPRPSTVESAGSSASNVVRASPARTRGSRRMARNTGRLVDRPAIWNSSSACSVRSTAEAKDADELDEPTTLASNGSNCGGGV